MKKCEWCRSGASKRRFIHVVYGGDPIIFCSEDCKTEFLKEQKLAAQQIKED